MIHYRTIIHQYCPVLEKNVAIEKILDKQNSEQFQCLNIGQCNCTDGNCSNRLVSAYNIKAPEQY